MTAATDKQGKLGVSRHKDKLMNIKLARWPQQNNFSRMALTSKRRKAGSLLPDQEPPATLHWLLYTRVEVRVQPKTIPLFITDLKKHIWGFDSACHKNCPYKTILFLDLLPKTSWHTEVLSCVFNFLIPSSERSPNPGLHQIQQNKKGVEKQMYLPGRRTTTSVMKAVTITAAMNDGENMGSRICSLQPRIMAVQAANGKTTQCAHQIHQVNKMVQNPTLEHTPFPRFSQRCSQMLVSTHT